jgi:WD40 repeat protein
MLLSGPELSRALPLALPRASLHVGGRVNDVAFSPAAPLLAIASSQRKVVLWNFKTAQVERVIEAAFTHSVGRVAYTPSGALACGERSTGQAICTVYVYQDGNSYHLCNHEGTVTALESVGDNRLLTAGRDAHIAMWDLDDRRVLTDKEFPFWARAAEVSPDGQYVALLHARMSLARLPELTIVPGQPFIAPRERVGAYGTGYRRATGFSRARHTDEYRLNPGGTTEYRRGTGQHAAYSPDGKYILSGQHNGQLVLYYHTSLTQRPRQAVVTDHNGPVRGVHFLPGHPLVISAGADGEVRFIRWPEMTLAGMARETGGKLTSLHVSRSGSFMATGTSESSLRLWDLRTLDIPALFAQPLATATHDQISTVLALGEYETLPEPVRTALQFMRLLLQYRFRYDIQIEDAHTIRFGDFDILLEEG